jgi:hypothetical protein
VVKSWSTWVITSNTSLTITHEHLRQVNTSYLGQNPRQSGQNPLMSTPCLRTLAAFSNFCLNTQKSANIKVVQILVGYISSLRWHLKFGGKIAQNCKSNLLSLFLGAMKISKFTSSSCSNHCSKHMSTFVKVVGGYPLYKFPFW